MRTTIACACLLLALRGADARPAATACPPSCANNELLSLLDQYCSDKGTFWQSKHHYGTAYHSIFGSIRHAVSSILEIGIGEDTAPSVQAWATYFPNAHVFPIDIKTKREVSERAKPGGATDRLIKHQAQFGCEYNRSMWDNPRVHLTLETDASAPDQLQKVQLPESIDIILDDGSHKYLDQQRTLHVLWPKLRAGGFYVVEDMLVGALPWSRDHANQVPTKNTDCGVECFFPQRLAEHPFLFDRFGHLKGASAPMGPPLEPRTKELLRANDWFWVITGVHQGGGLDASLIIRKKGPPIGYGPGLTPLPMPVAPQQQPAAAAAAANSCPAGCVDASATRTVLDALRAADGVHASLRSRIAELSDAVEMGGGAGGGAGCNRNDTPLLGLLAASLIANVVLLARRQQHGGPRNNVE